MKQLKGILISIMMLLTCIIIVSDRTSATTWYVNDGESIQSVIDNASDGDTIFVYSGTYNESIIINMSLSLIGESSLTIINCSPSGVSSILIKSSNVSITRFTIIGDYNPIGMGIAIINSSNVTISDCIIYNNSDDGIRMNSCWDNRILDCNIYNNGDDGIDLSWSPSKHNYISGNTCTNNRHGIVLFQSDNNSIYNNKLSTNREIGVYMWNSSNNTIYSNNLLNNNQNAYDDSNNTWYNISTHKGNYWSDYLRYDDNHNGVGDTPYVLGNIQDLYPLGKFRTRSSSSHTIPNPPIPPSPIPNPPVKINYSDKAKYILLFIFLSPKLLYLLGWIINIKWVILWLKS